MSNIVPASISIQYQPATNPSQVGNVELSGTTQIEPGLIQNSSVENYVPTDVTTAGPPIPGSIASVDPVQLQEQYQRINAARFMR